MEPQDYNQLYADSYGGIGSQSSDFGGSDAFAQLQDSILGTQSGQNAPQFDGNVSMDGNGAMTAYRPIPGGLDPKIKKLALAIRQVETGGNYQARGASGEFGAYQFMPDTWRKGAKEILGDANAPMTEENQNRVAYGMIEKLANQGYKPDQIASIWNSGKPDYQGNVGVNAQGVKYDVPTYVQKVLDAGMAMPKAPTAPQVQQPQQQPIIPIVPQGEQKSVGGFLGNLVSSTGGFLKGIGSAVIHPIDTVTALGNLGLGILSNIKEQQDKAGPVGKLLNYTNPLTLGLQIAEAAGFDLSKQNEMADALGREYLNRYGSLDKIGNTLYNDPVGVAADVATILSAGAGAIGKVGTAGKIAEAGRLGETAATVSKVGRLAEAGKIAETASTAAKIADPLTYLAKAGRAIAESKVGTYARNLPTDILGITTGEGGGTFRQIYDAAKKGRTGAVEAMRGGVTDEQIVGKLDSAVNALKSEASNYWKKLGIDKMTKSLDVSPIFDQMQKGLDDLRIARNADGTLDFSRSKLRFDAKAQADIQKIVDTMSDYGTRAGDRLPSGVDTMKQAFATLYSENRDSRTFVEGMRKATRKILSGVKGYDEYAKNYGEIQDMLTQLKTEMSAGNKNASQTWRKLVNTFKQRNTEGRRAILGALNEKGISDLIDNIAGYGAKDVFKQSLVQNLGVGGAIITGNPLALPAFSPRIVGETMQALGKTVGKTNRAVEGASKLKGSNVVKYIGGQVYNKSKATRAATVSERMKAGQR